MMPQAKRLENPLTGSVNDAVSSAAPLPPHAISCAIREPPSPYTLRELSVVELEQWGLQTNVVKASVFLSVSYL